MVLPHMKKLSLVALGISIVALVGCTAPTAEDLANVEVATDMSHANALRVLPDFAATTYAGDNSCVLYGANNVPSTWRYRFVLANKTASAGTIPMVKIVIASAPANQSYTTYLFNVAMAPNSTQVMTINVPKMYPTTYQAEVMVDPANTVPETTKANNTLVQNVHFTSGLPGDGKCKD